MLRNSNKVYIPELKLELESPNFPPGYIKNPKEQFKIPAIKNIKKTKNLLQGVTEDVGIYLTNESWVTGYYSFDFDCWFHYEQNNGGTYISSELIKGYMFKK